MSQQAVQYVCRLLRSHGVGTTPQLTPELVRQAKFGATASCQPLLLAAHDLALLVLAGFPPNSCEALTRLRQQLQQEAVQEETHTTLSQPGRLLLLHCLSEWGCPAGLVAQLTLPQPSSRAALLVLCWLIAHAQLFDRALQQLQVPQHLLHLLPPYPQDTSLTAEAQSHYQAAAGAARQHHQHIQQLLQEQASKAACQTGASRGRSSSSTTNTSSSQWPAVQAAAHHVLATYRGATLRLQQLACLAEAREKLLHEVQQLQQAGGKQATAAGAGSSCSRTAQVLTPFELHLLAHPAVLQEHQQALEQATSLLQQQQECRQHAAVFFAWAASAVAEPPGQQRGQAAGVQRPAYGSQGTAANKQQPRRHGTLQQAQPPLAAPSLQEMLLLVQQLPPAHTQTAINVLSRVHKQLQQAAAAAGLLPDTPSTQQGQGDEDGTATGAVGAFMQQFDGCELGASAASPHPSVAAVTAAFSRAAAAALVESGVLPAACTQELQDLPTDLQHTVQQLQDAHADPQQRQQQDLTAAQQVLQLSSLQRQHQQPQQQRSTQQQRQQAPQPLPGSSAVQAASGMLGSGSGHLRTTHQAKQTQSQSPARLAESTQVYGTAGSSLQGAAVSDELQRLNSLALQVAKLLAKTRATNKQQLSAAAAQLLEAGDDLERQQLVLYQA